MTRLHGPLCAVVGVMLVTASCGGDSNEDSASRPAPAASRSEASEPAARAGCDRLPRGGDNTYRVEEAGTVEVRQDSGRLVLVEVRPAPGWTSQVVRDDGSAVHVDLRQAANGRRFESALINGSIIVDVCEPAN